MVRTFYAHSGHLISVHAPPFRAHANLCLMKCFSISVNNPLFLFSVDKMQSFVIYVYVCNTIPFCISIVRQTRASCVYVYDGLLWSSGLHTGVTISEVILSWPWLFTTIPLPSFYLWHNNIMNN